MVEVLETKLGKKCAARLATAMKVEKMATMFPPKAVALGCVFVSLEEGKFLNGYRDEKDRVREWVAQVGQGRVEWEDFEDVVIVIRDHEKDMS